MDKQRPTVITEPVSKTFQHICLYRPTRKHAVSNLWCYRLKETLRQGQDEMWKERKEQGRVKNEEK